jgi:hypothetical protein
MLLKCDTFEVTFLKWHEHKVDLKNKLSLRRAGANWKINTINIKMYQVKFTRSQSVYSYLLSTQFQRHPFSICLATKA